MADTKITALTALTAADPANDVIPIVDVSDTTMAASGTTKKISVNNILGASGTATLASATITGDLTVRTNKLSVTNTGVGFGMTPVTPISAVVGTTGAVFFRTTDPAAPVSTPYIQAPASTGFSSISPVYGFWYQGCGIGNPALNNVSVITDSTERYKIDITGVATWSEVGGVAGTAMTLNATGLGVGVSPAAGDGSGAFKAAGTGSLTANSRVGLDVRELVSGNTAGIILGAMTTENTAVIGSRTGSGNIAFQTYNGASWGERMRIDYLGNLILQSPATPATLTTNGQLTVNATSNTNLRFSYRGSDGVTRVANITLA